VLPVEYHKACLHCGYWLTLNDDYCPDCGKEQSKYRGKITVSQWWRVQGVIIAGLLSFSAYIILGGFSIIILAFSFILLSYYLLEKYGNDPDAIIQKSSLSYINSLVRQRIKSLGEKHLEIDKMETITMVNPTFSDEEKVSIINTIEEKRQLVNQLVLEYKSRIIYIKVLKWRNLFTHEIYRISNESLYNSEENLESLQRLKPYALELKSDIDNVDAITCSELSEMMDNMIQTLNVFIEKITISVFSSDPTITSKNKLTESRSVTETDLFAFNKFVRLDEFNRLALEKDVLALEQQYRDAMLELEDS